MREEEEEALKEVEEKIKKIKNERRKTLTGQIQTLCQDLRGKFQCRQQKECVPKNRTK